MIDHREKTCFYYESINGFSGKYFLNFFSLCLLRLLGFTWDDVLFSSIVEFSFLCRSAWVIHEIQLRAAECKSYHGFLYFLCVYDHQQITRWVFSITCIQSSDAVSRSLSLKFISLLLMTIKLCAACA